MSALPIRAMSFLVLLLGLTGAVAQTTRPSDAPTDKARRAEDEKKTDAAATKAGEPLRAPADSILVIVEQAADALKMAPKFLMVPPEKWKEITDELNRLRSESSARAVATPSTIQITGKIDNGVASLQITYALTTDRPNSLLNLGCGPPTLATAVSLDGRTPQFNLGGDSSYSVLIEKPGDHEVRLEVLAPARGAHLLLDVPRAPTTNIELTLPAGTKEIRASERPINESFPFLKIDETTIKGPLGVLEKKLDLSWKAAGASSSAGPVLLAVGKIQVRVEDRRTVTEAALTLRPLGGPTTEWRLISPPGADLKVRDLEASRYRVIEDPNNRWVRTIRFNEPEEEPLTVTLTQVTDSPKPGKLTPVGPFLVLGALRQSGDLFISSSVPGLRLECLPRGDLARRDLSDEERRRDGIDAFSYRVLSPPAKPPIDPSSLGLLDLEAEDVKRSVETLALTHAFRLMRDERDEWQWQLTSTIKIQPLWAGADRMSIDMPAEWDLDDRNPPVQSERIERIETYLDKEKKVILVRFAHGRTVAESMRPLQFQLKLLGPHASEMKTAELPFPRLVNAIERGSVFVSLTLPDELELAQPPVPGNPSLDILEQSSHQISWKPASSADRLPERLRVAWRTLSATIAYSVRSGSHARARVGPSSPNFALSASSQWAEFGVAYTRSSEQASPRSRRWKA